MNHERIIMKMIDFYQGSVHDIAHFLAVHAYTVLLTQQEALPPEQREAAEVAAIVHDISCPLCREKYGSAGGKEQERESEALLRPFLAEFHLQPPLLERVIWLVSHHHSYDCIDGADYQILVEADFIVNASESGYDRETVQRFYDRIARTESGRRLLRSIFLRENESTERNGEGE